MNQYDHIIIGAGLGGLQCAYILAKHGRKVCVLERQVQIGGCLQSFYRGGKLFDTGFHYVGGLDEGQTLHHIFNYFNLLDLPWKRLDEHCFDQVIIGNNTYSFANGYELFVETLSKDFPHQRENLEQYVSFLKSVGDKLKDSLLSQNATDIYTHSLFAQSAHEFLCKTISDPLLRQVLSGTALKMELCDKTLPLYVFAQINNSYIQSAWRLSGGGQQIADRLAQQIIAMGGTVRTKAEVTHLTIEGGKVTSVEINGSEQLTANSVISNVHPAVTVKLLSEGAVRRSYKTRMTSLINTSGIVTANLALKPDQIEYLNRNFFIHKPNANLWDTTHKKTIESLLVSYQIPHDSSDYTTNIDLLAPMPWQKVSAWEGTSIGRRGDDYLALKSSVLEEMLCLAEPHIPNLRAAIDKAYVSTALTYQNYTLTVQGSAYGVRKDYTSPMTTILTSRTPIENLLLTGQNLNLHGILGVSMTALFTCAEILGIEKIISAFDVKNW